MKCEDFQLMISTYIDNALDTKSQGTMFTHLAGCTPCREFLRHSLDLRTGLLALPQPEVPLSLDRRVMRLSPLRRGRLQGAGKTIRALWSHRLSVPLPSAALIALVLVTVTLLSASLWQTPEVVPLPCLPTIEVFSDQPVNSPNSK